MADQGIKKVVIEKKSLPPISGEYNGYILRYRIISEDKNRYSHWSPQYKISLDPQNAINFSFTVDATKNTVNLIWNSVSGVSNFDIYTKLNTGDWVYSSTVSSNSYSSLISSSATTVQIAVQVPTYPKKRYADATLFTTAATAI
jgi:hypothetical protein